MSTKHIADAEDTFLVVCITPDFCVVGGSVIPFDITQVLSREQSSYSKSVYARGEKILLVDSVIRGVLGNAGQGVKSGVSLIAGSTKVQEGSTSVIIEGKQTARHEDLVLMNGVF